MRPAAAESVSVATESKRITVTARASAVARTGVGKASTHLLAVRDCDRGRYAAGEGGRTDAVFPHRHARLECPPS